MGHRFGTFMVCLLLFVPHCLCSQAVSGTETSGPRWTATVQVLVRDKEGHPLAGLGADDFTLAEGGSRDRVLSVRNLNQSSTNGQSQTSVLLVLAPASAPGRNTAIKGLLKYLDSPIPGSWTLALIDDTGKFTPFSHDTAVLRARLQQLAHEVSPFQFYGGSWPTEASRAMQQLALRIGRHAIVFATDFEFDVSDPDARDRRLARFGPSDFISDAVLAQAAMYTVEASGSRVTIPFGGAAEVQYFGSGQEVAEAMRLDMVNAFRTRGDFLSGANETGGLAASDIQEALSDVAADAAGYYQITFVPNLQETDGAWHPISVSVPGRHVRLRGPRYYLAPTSETQQRIQATILAAFGDKSAPRLDTAAHVWLFPDSGGVHTALLAADFVWPVNLPQPPTGRKLQIYTQLVNESMGQLVGGWFDEQPWKHNAARSHTVHWQRETPLYPGRYSLRVIALDPATATVGTREFAFAIYPSAVTNFHLSEIIIADRCLAADEVHGRANLLDPLLLNGCILAPSASASFSAAQSPTMMVRIYTIDPKLRDTVLKQWKACIIVGDGLRIPVSITSANIRGLVVTTPLDLRQLNLNRGVTPIEVVFEARADDGSKHTIAIRSQLTVSP
jgi:VWFA-related protein